MSWEIALLGVTAAASAGSAISGSMAERRAASIQADAADMERQQFEEMQRQARIQALSEERDRMEKLRLTLASNEATASSQGVGIGTPTFEALEEANVATAGRDISNIRLLGESRAARYGMGAYQKEIEARGYRNTIKTSPWIAGLRFAGDMGRMALLGFGKKG